MRVRSLFALPALVAAALAVQAATLVKLSDADLALHGQHIVLGSVTRVATSWEDPDGDGTSQIYTTVDFRVEQALKGGHRPGDTVSFRQLGGRIGNIEYKVSGIPVFKEGDAAVLFLEGSLDNPHYSPIVGLAQGRWLVRTDQDGNRFARRDFSDSCFVRLDKNQPVEDAKPSDAEETLAAVLDRFQKEIAAQEAQKESK